MSSTPEVPEIELLPDLYQRWVDEWLPGGIPREYNASCMNCAMCPGEGAVIDGGPGFYNPATKCCTYFPKVPNFLAGRAIANDNPGAAALRAFIRDDACTDATVNLRGVQPSARTVTLYANYHNDIFGRDASMLCPYAIEADTPEGPLCGIWQQRNAVCSTWFCKHTKGATGVTFWHALQGLFGKLEGALSWWAIAQVLPEPARAIGLAEVDINRSIEIALHPDAWRFWQGSRESFYEACADRVDTLSADDAIRIAGMDAEMLRLELGSRYAALRATTPPGHLRAVSFQVLEQDGKKAMLQSRRCKEAFEVPALLLRLLHYFDGRPTEETLEAIRQETKVRLEPGLVRRLYDFGILETTSGTDG